MHVPTLNLEARLQNDMEKYKKNVYFMFETNKPQFTGGDSALAVMPISLASLGGLILRNVDVEEECSG